MKMKSLLYRSLAEPRLAQLEYAEECLTDQENTLRKKLAALNMGFYPFQGYDEILQDVREDKNELEQDLEALA
jgi:hypothetical protein